MNQLSRLLSYAKPYTAKLAAAALLMATAAAAQALFLRCIRFLFNLLADPQSTQVEFALLDVPSLGLKWTLNQWVPASSADPWTVLLVTIVVAFLIRGLFDYVGNYAANDAGLSSIADIRLQVFQKILRQDASFFEENATARVASSIMTDLEKIQVAMSHLLADLFRQLFTASVYLTLLFLNDWRLALFGFTVLPCVMWPTVQLGRRIRRSTRRAQDDIADLNQILVETIGGQAVVKSFGMEDREAERFRQANRRWRSSSLRYAAQQAIASPLIEFFGAISIVLLLIFARQRITAGQIDIGGFMEFVTALLLLYEPVKRLTGIYAIFQQALGASQKVFEYLDEPQRIVDAAGAKPLLAFRQGIEFRDVTFRYPSSQSDVLSGINLQVNAGEVVALVGPSGAGKSTIASLTLRFYDVTRGQILVDGEDIRNLTLASVRAQIGIVSQDTFLFNDTVGNNIRYGSPDAPQAAVEEAARHALALDFIERLPEGFDTVIGERGHKLSGGQRQRLAIARALLKNPPILILDEATSHLDTESEMLVQRALANLMQNRTVLVIAHRLSTVRRADKIVALERGKVMEIGTHEELLAGKGIYQRLHALQFLEAGLLETGLGD